MRSNLLLYLLATSILFSCQDKYPGYSEVSAELFKRLHTFGRDSLTVEAAHFVKLSVSLGNLYEGIDYWTESEYQNLSREYMGKGDLGGEIAALSAGDSVSFIMPYYLVKESLWDEFAVDERNVPDTLMMQLHIKIQALLDDEEYGYLQQEKVRNGIVEENKYLREYLKENGWLGLCDTVGDVYVRTLKQTYGAPIRFGSTIQLDYRSFFLDGREFDSTLKGETTMWFDLGKPDQVVKGLEMALATLRDGEEARVYVPSHLGFGQRGSSTHVVPALTSVYFDVRVELFQETDSLRNG